ncbi:hypothetical protein [Rhodococcus sp. USK13]|uniref:hypothetical protein n=1 Tax=Rhodococcus sp. USK13 TaxID=2806442 RepID=UPI001BD02172|nr:hypothetical protein [Rhodococcus sp. USK13]
MTTEQLDLFDERDYDAEAAAKGAWRDRMVPADWVAPYDCGYGPAGTVVSGWRCPACGKVEPNGYILLINHGIDPHIPGDEGFLTECISMDLRAVRATVEARA